MRKLAAGRSGDTILPFERYELIGAFESYPLGMLAGSQLIEDSAFRRII
jgi:hypothetical protein